MFQLFGFEPIRLLKVQQKLYFIYLIKNRDGARSGCVGGVVKSSQFHVTSKKKKEKSFAKCVFTAVVSPVADLVMRSVSTETPLDIDLVWSYYLIK